MAGIKRLGHGTRTNHSVSLADAGGRLASDAEEPSSCQHVGIPQNWGINMIYTERRSDHLKKASEAKAQVARAIDPVARKAWEQIAAGYQELANLAPGKESKWHA